ncbi:hypothetical protein [Pseudophaeobacter sp.]|uniref:hypothetical protein n=2 Tax=Pseudophaeobacter sp. TaxID=1971739 RepID=UPI0040585AC0
MMKLHAAIGAIGIGAMTVLPAYSAEPKSILCSVNTCSLNSFYLATGRGDPLECLNGSFLLEVSIEGDVLKMDAVGSVKRERVFFGELPLQTTDPFTEELRAVDQTDEHVVVATLFVDKEWTGGEFSLVEVDRHISGDTTMIAGTCEKET